MQNCNYVTGFRYTQISVYSSSYMNPYSEWSMLYRLIALLSTSATPNITTYSVVAYRLYITINRVGQSREIYSNSVPLSPPHWPYPKHIRPPSLPQVAVASSTPNTKLFTWRTCPGAGAVPKCDWAARSQCGSKHRRANHTKYIWYVATHSQSVITTELMIA